ncbi:hypothetical protein LRS10_19805 [Phenylobacterium sp. J426]|uniref:hypothetical protein n=1 Tax=Phenylobacterium sp. J426 TaxID=2898439 RepID=UPI0027E2C2D4|nr:hypothetical protein [Phenylobacterium sp. J426]MCR5876191.1 hypothetical protein [Phenylobacterium sp. J426]
MSGTATGGLGCSFGGGGGGVFGGGGGGGGGRRRRHWLDQRHIRDLVRVLLVLRLEARLPEVDAQSRVHRDRNRDRDRYTLAALGLRIIERVVPDVGDFMR